MPSFHGNFCHGIDPSRRVMCPARWRPKDRKVLFTAILWPIEAAEFLLVLPPERWQVMLDKLKMRSLLDKRVAALERYIGMNSAQLELDRIGRFCLPDHLASGAGLEDEALFVGRLEKFEIWNPKRHAASRKDDQNLALSLLKEMEELEKKKELTEGLDL